MKPKRADAKPDQRPVPVGSSTLVDPVIDEKLPFHGLPKIHRHAKSTVMYVPDAGRTAVEVAAITGQ